VPLSRSHTNADTSPARGGLAAATCSGGDGILSAAADGGGGRGSGAGGARGYGRDRTESVGRGAAGTGRRRQSFW